ncbi:MAG: KH domain-containing protein [Candidatus Marinimicrobia bacterium]|nr:KH domain-containing protein [Candidatus Neomarinimicrobiota bacterium]
MEKIIDDILKRLVSKPKSVVVKQIERDGINVIQVSVDPEDRGRAIGKNGRMAKALRVIIQSISMHEGDSRTTLEIVE